MHSFDSRKSADLGIRLGVRSGMGRCHLFTGRRDPAAVRQGVGGDLLQGEEDSARISNASLGPAARPAGRCSLTCSQVLNPYINFRTFRFDKRRTTENPWRRCDGAT